MSSEIKPDDITRLHRACRPDESLNPDDPRYVNCDNERGVNLVDLLERGLRRADPAQPQFKLFAGHRGVGKTSELLRLKRRLEQRKGTTGPFQVVYFDIAGQLDENDVDFPDLLVLTAAEVHKQLRKAEVPNFDDLAKMLRGADESMLKTLAKRVSFKEVSVGPCFAKLTAELRNRPDARAELRQAIERHATSLLEAVNDLLRAARVELRKLEGEKRREGLVVIIDGLDKVVRRQLPDGTNTHERIFIHRREQLASLQAHTVYTVPISLYYSPESAQLEQTIGEFNKPMPMIRLRPARNADVTDDSPGMCKMWEIIEKRCQAADVEIADVFDDKQTGYYLCRMSGGHPRHLMMFLQSAASYVDALPITRDAAESAVRDYANSLRREIPDRFWDQLRKFATPQDDIPKDDDHQQMLLLLHVFEYMNGAPWYEVNPVIRELERFKAG